MRRRSSGIEFQLPSSNLDAGSFIRALHIKSNRFIVNLIK